MPITGPFYLAGHTITQGVTAVQDEPEPMRSVTVFGDRSKVVDVAFPFDDCAVLPDWRTWRLTWNDAQADHYVHELIRAWPDHLDFCPFVPLMEVFSGDGANKTFVTMRRPFESFLASSYWPTPAGMPAITLSCKINASSATAPAIGAADSLGRCTLTFSSAPANGTRNVWIYYAPIFRMLVSGPAGRDYTDANREKRTLVLVEG